MTLRLYRSLVRTARLIPSQNDSQEALHEVRRQFRENQNIRDEKEVQELVKKGEDRLRFLRTKARRSSYARSHKPVTRVVALDGKLIDVEEEIKHGKKFAFCKDMRLDTESLKKHQKLMRRAQFLERPPVR